MNRNSAILRKGAEHKQLQPWRPRDGTGLTLTRLLDELRDALGAYGINQASLDERLPTAAQIASRFNSESQSRLDDLLQTAGRGGAGEATRLEGGGRLVVRRRQGQCEARQADECQQRHDVNDARARRGC